MVCFVCGKENWRKIEFQGMAMEKVMHACLECGNICYHSDPKDEEKLKAYYRTRYNDVITFQNITTSIHKLNYIKLMLDDFLKDKKDLVCGDIGCATGYILHWLQGLGHKVTGSEYRIKMRRFCEHYYDIPVSEELETKHKYDLLTLNHVFEHLIEPDKKLAHYVSLLKDDGHMYISTPRWFDYLEEPGGRALGQRTEIKPNGREKVYSAFEHFHHPDHINLYSEQTIKNMFRVAGLDIVKENHTLYGQTYLLKKGAPQPIVKEDVQVKVTILDKMNKALICYAGKKYQEAIDIYPRFPEAWVSLAFDSFRKEPTKQQSIFEEALKLMPENPKVRLSFAIWLYQKQAYPEALKHLDWLILNKPNEEILMYRGWCYAILGKPKDAIYNVDLARMINPLKWAEATNWICQQASTMPCWEEVAAEETKKRLFKDYKKVEMEVK